MPATRIADAVEPLLPAWLARQRWFSGKERPVDSASVVKSATLSGADPLFEVLVVEVRQRGASDRYTIYAGARRELPERLSHASVGQAGDLYLYDAPHDGDLMALLLEALSESRRVDGLRFEALVDLKLDLASLVVGAEQSNTSVIFGEEYILKLFRRIAPGLNPDLEITRALADAGCEHIVPPYGYLETDLAGQPTTLGLLQPFLRSATDGWALATTSIRDLYAEGDLHAGEVGGDFAAESERLGQATAEVHRMLAATLPSRTAPPEELAALVAQMNARLDDAVKVARGLAPFEQGIRAVYDQLGQTPKPQPVQRIHGDFHLGQVMRTPDGWVLFDFEGEPTRPLVERTALMSPLRDVAGMLRSFDYAARYLLADQPSAPQLAYRAAEWAERNREAFCDGYAEGAGADPRAEAALLRAFELDKAVYEVVYETRNRPSWLGIPLGSIERLVS
jgi:maltokinase